MKRAILIGSIAVAIVLAQIPGTTRADEARPNLGLLMWSAFQCSTFAELSKNKKEQARLFHAGYAAGEKFLSGIRQKTLPKEEVNKAPIGVLLLLQGPNNEFLIGRIFQSASDDAFDSVTKEDNNGITLPVSEWIMDTQDRKIIAEAKYTNSNCALILRSRK